MPKPVISKKIKKNHKSDPSTTEFVETIQAVKAEKSGVTLVDADASIIKGMIARGDRQHDIASWFGVNGGRIAEISTGTKFADAEPASADILPPPGPYVVRGIEPIAPAAPTTPVGTTIPPISAKIVMMDPAMAKIILERNTRNRPIRAAHVERYARDMRESRWQLNGETIIISDLGNLMNGQHRLHAVIKANVMVPMMIAEGVPDSAFSTLDAGMSRSAGDVLSMRGIVRAHQVAAVTRMILNYKNGSPINTARSNREIEESFVKHPDIEQKLQEYAVLTRLGHGSMVSTICYLAEKYGTDSDRQKAKEFVEGVSSGANLSVTDPRLVFRNKLIAFASDPARRPEQTVVWYFTQRALNYYIEGRAVSKIFPAKGVTPHFSEIVSAPRAIVEANW